VEELSNFMLRKSTIFPVLAPIPRVSSVSGNRDIDVLSSTLFGSAGRKMKSCPITTSESTVLEEAGELWSYDSRIWTSFRCGSALTFQIMDSCRTPVSLNTFPLESNRCTASKLRLERMNSLNLLKYVPFVQDLGEMLTIWPFGSSKFAAAWINEE
jgi:hypothetical protein